MLGFIQAPPYLCFLFMCFDGVYESDMRQANLPFSLLIFIFIPAPRFSLSLRAWFWEEDCHTQTLAHHFHWTVLNLHTRTVSYCSPGLPSSVSCVRFHFCLPFFSRIMVRSSLVKWSSCCLLLWCTGQLPLVDVAVTTPFQVGIHGNWLGKPGLSQQIDSNSLN